MVRVLDQVGVSHMVVGSFASSAHGSPRTTQDLDLVIEMAPDQLQPLLDALDTDRYYVPHDSARLAVASGGQFDLVEVSSGWKVDLMVRRSRPFSVTEFGRRRLVTFDGVEVAVASPEDTVLAKLEWALLGGSDRQVADAAGVLAVLGATADDAYLDRWAAELGVVAGLAAARALAAGSGDG